MDHNLKTLVRQYFPFENFNEGQEVAIIQCVEAVLSGAQHIVLSSPVATGKSAIATTAHKVLRHIHNYWRSTIVTASRGLQNQYISSDPLIYDLKGRTNYPCSHNAGHYNTTECRAKCAMGKCNKMAHCAYYQRRKSWCEEAPLRLTNTAFHIVAPACMIASDDTRANLVIIDECHELPNQLVEHSTFDVTPKNMYYGSRAFGEGFLGVLSDFINSFMNTKEGTAFHPEGDLLVAVDALKKELYEALRILSNMNEEKSMKPNILTGAEEEVNTLLEQLNLLTMGGEWMLTEFVMSEKVELKPVYASQVAFGAMFCKAKQFIHMSATICGFEEYQNSLGITGAVCIDVKNPINPRNRPVVYTGKMKVSGEYDPAILARHIDHIIKKHDMSNGVIHSVSFKLAEEIKKHSKYGHRMLISNDRQEIVSTLNQHNKGKIIVSPSVTTGYDFKGDMAKWQIIAKIPFKYKGSPWIRLNMERHPRWYAREAILTVVQASGRVCRGIDDKGITYILDKNFEFLFRDNHDLFPDWWIESLIIPQK